MSANKMFFLTLVLLGAWALVAGCGSDSVAPTDDEAPILPPTGVTATGSQTSEPSLSWDPNSHPNLEGYNVYRKEVAKQDVEKLTPEPISETNFTDTTARRGVKYEYRVTAVTKSGKESAYTPIQVLIRIDQHQPYTRDA
jgi:fibronectin type 3 domain-containing protein